MAQQYSIFDGFDDVTQPEEEQQTQQQTALPSIFDGFDDEPEPVPDEFVPPKPGEFERPEDVGAYQTLTFNELSGDDDYMDMLREYNHKRFGEKGDQGDDETDADYLRRFLTHTREFEFNSLDLGAQLDWVRNANTDERMKFGYLYSQLDRLPDFYEEGGTGSVSAIRDFGKSLLLDPLNYIGFGAGKAASFVATRAITQALKQGGKKMALEMAAKEASKYGAKKILGTKAGRIAAGGIAAESGAAAVQDLKLQEVERLSQKYGEDTPEEKDLVRAATVGAFGLGAGAVGYRLSGGLGGDRLLKNVTDSYNKKLAIKEGLDKRNNQLAKAEAAERSNQAIPTGGESATGIFDLQQGREVLEEMAEGASADQARQYNSELMNRVGGVLTDVVRDMADSGELSAIIDADTKAFEVMARVLTDNLAEAAKKGGKAGDAIDQTKKMLEEMDSGASALLDFLPEGMSSDQLINSLEQAISKQGLSIEQFRNAFGASASEAAQVLRSGSEVGKILKAFREIDPEFQQQLKVFDDPDGVVTPIGKAVEFGRKLDRERRALMVTQISTTMRNVYSAVTRLGMDGLANSLESVLYQMGRQVSGATEGQIGVNAPRFSLRQVFRDGFGAAGRMADTLETAEISDALLKHNPSLLANMNRSLNELAPDKELTKATRFLNGLNVAQDLFFRRGVFVDAIDKQLRRAGVVVDNPGRGQFKSIEEFVASGKVLPPKMLENAVDESLAFTFARIPKETGGKAGDSLAHSFLKFNEKLGPIPAPIGTAAFPFAKFMVNAMQFQFQYSPGSIVTGLTKGTFTRNALRKASDAARKAGELADEAAEQAKKAGNMNLSAAKRKEAKALAKEADKKALQAQQIANQARKEVSTGVVGTAALYAAIKHRAENQDTNWYEYKTDDGRTGDLRPYFPITPYLAIADLIVKAGGVEEASFGTIDQPEITADINLVDTFEGITGAQFRTGTSSFVVDQMQDLLAGETDFAKSEKLGEVMGQYVGELFGAGVTPLRVVRDVQAAYDTEAAMIRDARQTEGIGFGERFVSGIKTTIAKELPATAKDLPEFQSATRDAPLFRQSSLTSQLLGTPRKIAPRSAAEKELVRLGIKDYTIVPGSGDKGADALVKKYMGREFEREINDLVNSESYKSKSLLKQKAAINNRINQFRSRAKQLAVVEAENAARTSDKSFTPFDKAQYTRLSKLKRKLVDEYYRQHPDYGGRSVAQMQELQPEVNHLRQAIRLANALAKQ